MVDLFGNESEVIRTLGFYQPFGSLMLPPYNKIETRKVSYGRKPPFPIGKYLIYTTLNSCNDKTLYDWCGPEIYSKLINLLKKEQTIPLNGYAIGIGNLKSIRVMTDADEEFAYVGNYYQKNKENWCLIFDSVTRIEPFRFVDDSGKSMGKQGVGLLPPKYYKLIKPINHFPPIAGE